MLAITSTIVSRMIMARMVALSGGSVKKGKHGYPGRFRPFFPSLQNSSFEVGSASLWANQPNKPSRSLLASSTRTSAGKSWKSPRPTFGGTSP